MDFFCGGEAFLPDGRLLVAGGIAEDDMVGDGLAGSADALAFDPVTEQWATLPRMAHGRWYPTLLALGNGQVVAVSGIDEHGNVAAALDRFADATGWTELAAVDLSLYPHLFVLADGRIFASGGQMDTGAKAVPCRAGPGPAGAGDRRQARGRIGGDRARRLGPPGRRCPGLRRRSAARPAADAPECGAPARPHGPRLRRQRRARGRAAGEAGGGDLRAGAGRVDGPGRGARPADVPLRGAAAAGRSGGDRRSHPKKGTQDAWEPPDPREELRLEVFSPPDLFRRERPQIAAAPAEWRYRTTIDVTTPQAGAIRCAHLIRPGVTTHAFNNEQHLVDLRVRVHGPAAVTVELTDNANVAPPGWHMLFLVGDDRVPSVAYWVRVVGP